MKLRAYRVQPKGMVNSECAGCTQPLNEALIIAFTDHFKVILHPNQSSVGNVILATRRHVARICDFTPEESTEFTPLLALLEPALERAFGAELINLYYQRNWAYRTENPDPPFKDGKPNPHVHCHIVPRYSNLVHFAGMTWEDKEFGEPYVWNRVSLTAALRDAVIARIREQLDLAYE
jgi:diadenosine tetraphosphate (Ap4A) HIT family hydrolase